MLVMFTETGVSLVGTVSEVLYSFCTLLYSDFNLLRIQTAFVCAS
jgi:hypothetical protein